MDRESALRRVRGARVARLGTVDGEGRPHLVPCCFVLEGDTAYTAVDAKPKSTLALRRLANIERHPATTLLVDHYDEDWSKLWWVRMDGLARVVSSERETGHAREALRSKYRQYGEGSVALNGPVIALSITHWVSWP